MPPRAAPSIPPAAAAEADPAEGNRGDRGHRIDRPDERRRTGWRLPAPCPPIAASSPEREKAMSLTLETLIPAV